MHRILGVAAIAATVIAGACSGGVETMAGPGDAGELSSPIHEIATGVGECFPGHNTIRYPYWLPGGDMAESVGYGFVSAELDKLSGASSVQRDQCSTDDERIPVVEQAVLAAQAKLQTQGIYEEWSLCMQGQGFEGLGTPMDRAEFLLRELYTPTEGEELSETLARGETLKSLEKEMAQADRTCQSKYVVGRFGEIRELEQELLDEAPADVLEILQGT